jgi:hypothetical protein
MAGVSCLLIAKAHKMRAASSGWILSNACDAAPALRNTSWAPAYVIYFFYYYFLFLFLYIWAKCETCLWNVYVKLSPTPMICLLLDKGRRGLYQLWERWISERE